MADQYYNITLLTFSAPVPTGATPATLYIPFYNVKKISLSAATQSSFALEDDDGIFDELKYYREDLSGQTLRDPVIFGSLPDATATAAGTRLTYFHGGIIRELDGSGLPTGNEFRLQFPVNLEEQIIGGKTAVMVMPVGKTDGSGVTTYPVFNKSAPFAYARASTIGSIQDNQIPYGSPAIISGAPCFVTGTMIETDSGPRRIESLSAGDYIRTRDHGLRRLQWVGCKTLDASALDVNPALRPIVIEPHALCPGLPRHRLTVSPQHRVLINVRRLPGGEEGGERLVAAKHLVGLPGIYVANPLDGVTYWHLLFDGHELVRSNGTWTESLYTGPEAMRALTTAARREIIALFPHLANAQAPATPTARPFLTGKQGRTLTRRHSRTGKVLIESGATV